MPKVHKSGGSKKKLRSARNKRTGKYERQRVRTEANKARKKAKLLTKE